MRLDLISFSSVFSFVFPLEHIKKGAYDQRDLDRLDKDDAYARAFLRTLKSRGDVAKAADLIDEAFKFRKQIDIWGKAFAHHPTALQAGCDL